MYDDLEMNINGVTKWRCAVCLGDLSVTLMDTVTGTILTIPVADIQNWGTGASDLDNLLK